MTDAERPSLPPITPEPPTTPEAGQPRVESQEYPFKDALNKFRGERDARNQMLQQFRKDNMPDEAIGEMRRAFFAADRIVIEHFRKIMEDQQANAKTADDGTATQASGEHEQPEEAQTLGTMPAAESAEPADMPTESQPEPVAGEEISPSVQPKVETQPQPEQAQRPEDAAFKNLLSAMADRIRAGGSVGISLQRVKENLEENFKTKRDFSMSVYGADGQWITNRQESLSVSNSVVEFINTYGRGYIMAEIQQLGDLMPSPRIKFKKTEQPSVDQPASSEPAAEAQPEQTQPAQAEQVATSPEKVQQALTKITNKSSRSVEELIENFNTVGNTVLKSGTADSKHSGKTYSKLLEELLKEADASYQGSGFNYENSFIQPREDRFKNFTRENGIRGQARNLLRMRLGMPPQVEPES